MKSEVALLSGALLTIGLGSHAEAHSWYPNECCSTYDCAPADAIAPDKWLLNDDAVIPRWPGILGDMLHLQLS